MNNKKEGATRVTVLQKHLQTELEREETFSNYYQRVLKETQSRKETLENLNSHAAPISQLSKNNQNKEVLGN